MSKKLTKEQQKELKAVFKEVVKNGLKKNASSVRILSGEVTEEDGKFSIFVDAYFFTVIAEGLSTDMVRWNVRFVTMAYPTEAEAFESLKKMAADSRKYKFEKVQTPETAVYRNVYQSVYVETEA